MSIVHFLSSSNQFIHFISSIIYIAIPIQSNEYFYTSMGHTAKLKDLLTALYETKKHVRKCKAWIRSVESRLQHMTSELTRVISKIEEDHFSWKINESLKNDLNDTICSIDFTIEDAT